MEERYKLCDDGMARLLVWISNVEAQLANQDTVREDVAELKNQINVIRVYLQLFFNELLVFIYLICFYFIFRAFVMIWNHIPGQSTPVWIRFGKLSAKVANSSRLMKSRHSKAKVQS